MAAQESLAVLLDRRVREGELWEPLGDGKLRCFACGHRCLILPGQRGICKVRYNEGGRLLVPFGYVAGLQLDPVEKKPFFHAYPGSRALSFGMLGCDYHCGYCFGGETRVVTSRGVLPIEALFQGGGVRMPDGGEAAALPGWEAVTHDGATAPIRQVFRHPYRGSLVVVTPYYLPPFRCTPDHRVFATSDPASPPALVEARSLTPEHFLAVPKPLPRSGVASLDVAAVLKGVTRRENGTHFLVPIRALGEEPYEGWVYNLEVEGAHSYLANFVAVGNCQNWITSQAMRDPVAGTPPQDVTPEEIMALARRYKARILTSTYNEPLITSEWAVEVFRAAKPKGFVCSYVSNGNATPEVLDYIRPWVDLYKVDLKGFDDKHYRKLGGVLQVVLDSIRRIWAMGFWLEIVTLVVPGFNDSDDELRDIARFLVSVSPDIPWHVTAFHQDYKMTDRANTQVKTLIHAAEIGIAEGLRYVYAGNIPGRVGPYENTYCPNCHALLIERVGYTILGYNLLPGGECPKCKTGIPGRWD